MSTVGSPAASNMVPLASRLKNPRSNIYTSLTIRRNCSRLRESLGFLTGGARRANTKQLARIEFVTSSLNSFDSTAPLAVPTEALKSNFGGTLNLPKYTHPPRI